MPVINNIDSDHLSFPDIFYEYISNKLSSILKMDFLTVRLQGKDIYNEKSNYSLLPKARSPASPNPGTM